MVQLQVVVFRVMIWINTHRVKVPVFSDQYLMGDISKWPSAKIFAH